MSSEHSNSAEKVAAALRQINRAAKADASKLDDTDRMIALIETATAAFDVNDPRAVEGLFAAQGIALDVIFKDFIRRKFFTFENMRVALQAQSQCRATFKSLDEFKNPRHKPSAAAPVKNPSEQTVESANSAVGASA